jgi:hypothetical protein
MGIEYPVVGYLGFSAVKLAGYSLAAKVISTVHGRRDCSSFFVGAVRTLIGMAVGAAYYALWQVSSSNYSMHMPWYMAGLIPLRFMEWWLLLWLFYDRKLHQTKENWLIVICATLWSYLLDIPAVFGFMLTGGISIC